MSKENELEKVLDDDQLRDWFKSRDPERKKIDPFISEEAAEEFGGKASVLTAKEEEKKIHGVSFSEHTKQVKNVSINFAWFGVSIGLTLAIILALIF